jgi:hypothetical protein
VQLLAELVVGGDDHSAQLSERFAAHVDGAAMRDQQRRSASRRPPLRGRASVSLASAARAVSSESSLCASVAQLAAFD